jgi:hypothetical protein
VAGTLNLLLHLLILLLLLLLLLLHLLILLLRTLLILFTLLLLLTHLLLTLLLLTLLLLRADVWAFTFKVSQALTSAVCLFSTTLLPGGAGPHVPLTLPPLFDFTLANSVRDMWNAGVYPLAVLIAVFSGGWPYLKVGRCRLTIWNPAGTKRLKVQYGTNCSQCCSNFATILRSNSICASSTSWR